MTKVTSIRLSDEMAAKLDHLAAAVDRPRAWLIEQAIARYVEEEAWQIAAIVEAVTSYRAGTTKLVPHEDVMRRLDEKIQARLGDADTLYR
jgi:predicted transcriptional regulator